jgi:dihydrofolate reductase
MSKGTLSMIFAMDQNRLIGKNNDLPWHLPADMAYFKKTTTGHSVLMGRKTFESFGNKPLPDRKNIILTQNKSFTADNCEVIHSVEEAVEHIAYDEFFVIGGSEIYKLFLPQADRLYITHIQAEFEGDAYFPQFNEEEWEVTSSIQGIVDEKNRYPHVFKVYERIRK